MRIAVVGSINIDMSVQSERIPLKGETLRGYNLCYIPGGKGANQAVAIAKLGGEVEMFGCVGNDDHGVKMIENLKNHHVKTDHILVTDKAPTGLAMITVGENDNTIIVVTGANDCVDKDYIDSICDVLLTYDIIVLQYEIPAKTVRYVIELCHKHHKTIIFNPAPAANIDKDLIEMSTYITPNEHETRMIFKDESVEDILTRYKEKLIVTQGSKGVSVCLKSGEILNVPARRVNVVDTTGAGDTLNGAFAYKISTGSSIEDALYFANSASALAIGKLGAQSGMPTIEELEEYINNK